MPRQKNRKVRSDAGVARGTYAARNVVNPISTANMKVRFANSTSYAAKAGISSSYSYKCRDCGVLFTRVGAIAHFPQDCMELDGKPWFSSKAGNVGNNLPPTVTPHEALIADAAPAIAKTPAAENVMVQLPGVGEADFALDIRDITAYLEWVTKDRNRVIRELAETREELSKVKATKLSTEFWSTYREFRAT